MSLEIRRYRNVDWPLIQGFLRENARDRESSPLLDRTLFDWQHQGFGVGEEHNASQLLFSSDKLIGFIGAFPVIYQRWNSGQITRIPGIGTATWVVNQNYRSRGGGLFLIKELLRLHKVYVAVGTNELSARSLIGLGGFNFLTALNRYLIPLDQSKYLKLLSDLSEQSKVKAWLRAIDLDSAASLENIHVDPSFLEVLWNRSTARLDALTLCRTAEFWDWRYLKNEGFQYYIIGDDVIGGIVVVRIESVFDPNNVERHQVKVLRIIEIVPSDQGVWEGNENRQFIAMILGVLRWARSRGCVAADFQCSNTRFESNLIRAGFRKQNGDYQPPACSLAGQFQPFKCKPRRLNALWRVSSDLGTSLEMASENTHLLKSDCDMDRPNIWPLMDN